MNLRLYLTEPPCQPDEARAKYLSNDAKAFQWYEEALAKIPSPGQGWNPALMPAARAAKRAGVKLETFIADVVNSTHAEIPTGRLKEIDRAYGRCDLDTAAVKALALIPVATTDKPKPVMLPIPVENETENFLKALFKPEETVVIAPARFNAQRKREEPDDTKREAHTCREWVGLFASSAPSDYFKNTIGVYIKINPLQSGTARTDGGLVLPLAKDENVTDFRWLLVESDTDSKEQQLGAIHAAGFPYATVVDSGKKSLHALVRLDAENLEDFKKQAAEVYVETGKLLTLDAGNSHPSRYSRLPGCQRGENWQTLLEVHGDVPSVKENNRQKWLSGAFTLSEYYYMDMPKETTLLGNRFLCREGSMLFVGPSGIGKSSASVQCDILWSLGRPAFQIKPAFPLRILCIQAENDDGDMIEMTQGVMHGLHLTPSEIEAVGKNTLYRNYKDSTGVAFLAWLEKLVQAYRPDIVRLDPLQAYLGDDAKEVSATAEFFRATLNPILTKYQCASIVAHHTPKTTGRKTNEWSATDWMYAGAGNADLTNWARCVMVIDPVGDSQEVFRFVAAKRWKRIGWKDPAGFPTHEKFFKHASGGSIYWEDSTVPPKVEQGKKSDKNDLLNLVPVTGNIPKNVLLAKATACGIGVNKARAWLVELCYEKTLLEVLSEREGMRPEVLISRPVS